MDRRAFHAAAIGALLAAAPRARSATEPAPVTPGHDMSRMPERWMGKEQIAMLMYPQFTALDLIGPQYMFANLMGATVHLVAKTREPLRSDTGVALVPTVTFDECPKDLDILFTPGGTAGTVAAMRDDATLGFMADRGSRAKLVTSVCTGSLVLGAAGLLRGYRATSHWVALDLLTLAGATPVRERVVHDRNRITGAGVTAGLDFGLAIVAQLRDRTYAEAVQLLAEYDPRPPFTAGNAATAPKRATEVLDGMFSGFLADAAAAAKASGR